MYLFQVPPPTRFDLRFSLAGIPVRVHPLFWVIALLFGSGSLSLAGILIWVVAIFVSILVHELGHALAFRRFDQDSEIVLHFAGGLTVPVGAWGMSYNRPLSSNQQIAVSLAGPFAGFFLAIAVLAISVAMGGTIAFNTILKFLPFPLVYLPVGGALLNSFFHSLLWVNIFWGLVNLLPVFPLDGGNVARHVLVQRDPLGGLRTSLWVSVITGGLTAVVALVYLQSIYMAFLFGMLAFQSFQYLQAASERY